MNPSAVEDDRPLDRSVAQAAAQWLVRLLGDELSAAELAECERWRAAHPEHERAWQRALRVTEKLGVLPAQIGVAVLNRPDRRAALKTLAMLLTAAPAGYLGYRTLPWQEWSAEHRTGVGERKTIASADATRIELNTDTAIDVAYTAERRDVLLRSGEILIRTGKDPSHRPFVVHTRAGSIRALGTRFIVRQDDAAIRVTVTEGAVEIRRKNAADSPIVVEASRQLRFDSSHAQKIEPASSFAEAWTQGMLYARDMQLGALVAELSRYRHGIVRCDPAVASLRISGVFQLHNIDSVLAALPETLPVQVSFITRHWVTIKAP